LRSPGRRSCSRNGFARYPKTPASAASATSSVWACAVTITIGIDRSPEICGTPRRRRGSGQLTRRLDDVNFRRVVEALTIGRGVRFGERLAERLAA